jgi:hypothetical protein
MKRASGGRCGGGRGRPQLRADGTPDLTQIRGGPAAGHPHDLLAPRRAPGRLSTCPARLVNTPQTCKPHAAPGPAPPAGPRSALRVQQPRPVPLPQPSHAQPPKTNLPPPPAQAVLRRRSRGGSRGPPLIQPLRLGAAVAAAGGRPRPLQRAQARKQRRGGRRRGGGGGRRRGRVGGRAVGVVPRRRSGLLRPARALSGENIHAEARGRPAGRRAASLPAGRLPRPSSEGARAPLGLSSTSPHRLLPSRATPHSRGPLTA